MHSLTAHAPAHENASRLTRCNSQSKPGVGVAYASLPEVKWYLYPYVRISTASSKRDSRINFASRLDVRSASSCRTVLQIEAWVFDDAVLV